MPVTNIMKHSILAAALTMSALCVSPAGAQSAINWNGVYAGGYAGYAWSTNEGTDIGDSAGFPWRNIGERFSNKANGFTGGVQAGFNVQRGALIWGLEADLGYLGIRGSGQWSPYPDYIDTASSFAATLRGRLGVASHNTLFYFTGGAIVADLNNKVSLNNAQWESNFTGAQWGWTVGAGVEWALNAQWSLKTEYLYYSLGAENVATNNSCVTGDCYFKTNSTGSIVRIGLNYRFAAP